MKKQALAMMLILGLGSLTWSAAQGTRNDLFDLKKSRQELEVMRGILTTTIGFVSNELRGHETASAGFSYKFVREFGMGSHITAYYLYGQGATFIIPISSLKFATTIGEKIGTWTVVPKIAAAYDSDLNDSLLRVREGMDLLNLELAANNEEMASAAREAAEVAREFAEQQVKSRRSKAPAGGVVGGVPGGVAGGVGAGVGSGAGSSQAAPAAATPLPGQQKSVEEMRKRLEAAQEKVRRSREDSEARRKKMLESLTQVTGYLVEALANHGDSLTHVKPNEYINIIITTDEGMPLLGDAGEGLSTREVLSVQKSVITEYKAGRLTLDAFKQKVLHYNE